MVSMTAAVSPHPGPIAAMAARAAGFGFSMVSEDQGLPIAHTADIALTMAFAVGGAR